jgi:hypothetical protein
MFSIRSSRKSNSYSPSSSSSCCYLARTLNTKHGNNLHPSTWSMSSTLTTLPESPFCNHLLPPPPSHATTYIVDNATGDFSTPRNQVLFHIHKIAFLVAINFTTSMPLWFLLVPNTLFSWFLKMYECLWYHINVLWFLQLIFQILH